MQQDFCFVAYGPEQLIYLIKIRRVAHSHLLSEDEIAFPYFKDCIEAPYNRLKDDHQTIALVLVMLDQCHLEVSSGEVGKLREVLGEFEKLWVPHISIEEENFTREKLQTVLGIKEQLTLAKKLGRHGSKNSGPVALALPFLFYNLEGRDREAFMMPIP